MSQKPDDRVGIHGPARLLKELSMQDPIRYALNDPVERWLYDLLLLDATEADKI